MSEPKAPNTDVWTSEQLLKAMVEALHAHDVKAVATLLDTLAIADPAAAEFIHDQIARMIAVTASGMRAENSRWS